MREIKYLIFARGIGKNMARIAREAEEEQRRKAEEGKRELIKKYAISEKEREIIRGIIEQFEEQTPRLQDLEKLKEMPKRGLQPEEIKRRMKYAKNPLEIKQLNRQLAKAYRERGKDQ